MSITLHHIAKFFLYAAVFSVVIVMSSTFFPFIGGKYFFFRVTTEFAFMFLLLWWGFEAPAGVFENRLRKLFSQPLFIAVSSFMFSIMLATVFSDNPSGAFWSNYERGEGAFQMLHYYLFFSLLFLMLETREDWRFIFKSSLVAAGSMILYGLLAASFVNGFIGPYNPSEPNSKNLFTLIFSANRFQGSLGNPAYVAPYLFFIFFFLLWNWLTGTRKQAYNVLYGLLLLFLLNFFILSQTRGAFLGLIASIVVFLIYILFLSPRFRKFAAIGLVVLALTGLGVYSRFAGVSDVEALPGGRLLTTTISAASAQSRFWTWGSAWKGFLERPVFGWGLENFSTVFDKYFDTRHFVPGQSTETWFDRAHSIVFDYLAGLGAVGFLSYAAIFIVFYWEFFRARARQLALKASGKLIPLQSVWIAGLVFATPIGYLVQGLALFDVLPILMPLFLFLAFSTFEFQTDLYQSPVSAPAKTSSL